MTDPEAMLARRIAVQVLAHPSVVRLDSGPLNAIATYLPNERLVGVHVADGIEVGVVLGMARPLPQVVDELRKQVSVLAGGAMVDVTVAGIE